MDHFALLGLKVRDSVSGASGIVTSICFDLAGCVQGLVHPGLDKDGKIADTLWIDLKRLVATSSEPVIPVPSFDSVAGGQTLPSFQSHPTK